MQYRSREPSCQSSGGGCSPHMRLDTRRSLIMLWQWLVCTRGIAHQPLPTHCCRRRCDMRAYSWSLYPCHRLTRMYRTYDLMEFVLNSRHPGPRRGGSGVARNTASRTSPSMLDSSGFWGGVLGDPGMNSSNRWNGPKKLKASIELECSKSIAGRSP